MTWTVEKTTRSTTHVLVRTARTTTLFTSLLSILTLGGCSEKEVAAPAHQSPVVAPHANSDSLPQVSRDSFPIRKAASNESRSEAPDSGVARVLASTTSIVLYDNAGAEQIPAGSERRRKASPVTADQFGAALRDLKHSSKYLRRGHADVSMMATIADAHAATTWPMSRQRLSRLPVEIQTLVTGDMSRRDYYVKGTLKLSVTTRGKTGQVTAGATGLVEHGPLPASEAEVLYSGALVQEVTEVATEVEYCEEWWEGVLYIDECLTQEDLDAASAELAAADYEVENLSAQVTFSEMEHCQSVPPGEEPRVACEGGIIRENESTQVLATTFAEGRVGQAPTSFSAVRSDAFATAIGEFGDRPPRGPSVHCAQASAAVGALEGCAEQAIGFGLGLLGYYEARAAVVELMAGAPVRMLSKRATKIVLRRAIGGVAFSALGVGLTAGAYLQCIAE